MLNGTKTAPANYKRNPVGPRIALGMEASKNDRDKYATDHKEGKDKAGDKKAPVETVVKKSTAKLQPKPLTSKKFEPQN